MNQMEPNLPSPDTLQSEFILLDIMIVLAKYKRSIVALLLLASLTGFAVSFVMPVSYRATTKLLPPQQAQSSAAALLSQLGGVTSLAGGGGAMKNPSDLYIGMLKSRTIADRLIQTFDLKKVFDVNSLEKARILLDSSTFVTTGKDGLITVDVESRDRKLAPRLANGYVAELQRMTKVLAVTEAAQRRLFFEQQLETTKNNLSQAEITLKSTMDTGGVISVDNESRAIVETVARLKGRISAKEIELGSMSAFVTPNNQSYKQVQQELDSLNLELSRLENGRASAISRNGLDSKSGLESIKMLRDLKYNQMLYELLAKQYEAARLDEAKDNAVIQVLDEAVEPEHRSKPRRALIVLVGMMIGMFVGFGQAFFREAKVRALAQPAHAHKWSQFLSYLKWR